MPFVTMGPTSTLVGIAAIVLSVASAEVVDVQLGPRPEFLVNRMEDSPLKTKLAECMNDEFSKHDFSIGHRGACMQFPEHTKESYVAAARMGAGIIECDVTFTMDMELVCRHSQCDLHTTTNILATPLAEKCSVPFTPATDNEPASAKCCTSDITLAEFKTLCGKMDASDPTAATAEEYLGGTTNRHTDLYSTCGTLVTHAESIELIRSLGSKFTPELKLPSVEMPFLGTYTQRDYAQQMIDEYKVAGVDPSSVWVQSFSIDDVKYWIGADPEFGMQAVYLMEGQFEGREDPDDSSTWSFSMQSFVDEGIHILAPPMWVLVKLDDTGSIVPSEFTKTVHMYGLELITWTLERSSPLADGRDYHYQTVAPAIAKDADMLTLLNVLAKDVKAMGVFSDWPATTTYYANCVL
ncbi:unnamed protein product [Discosporangium mesarthrocarpum]